MPPIGHSTDWAGENVPPEFHAELGVAYSGLGDRGKASMPTRKRSLRNASRSSPCAILLELYVNSGAGEDLRRLVRSTEADIHGNTDCVQLLGLDCLKRGDLGRELRHVQEVAFH